jgi:hypothetical protein
MYKKDQVRKCGDICEKLKSDAGVNAGKIVVLHDKFRFFLLKP